MGTMAGIFHILDNVGFISSTVVLRIQGVKFIGPGVRDSGLGLSGCTGRASVLLAFQGFVQLRG